MLTENCQAAIAKPLLAAGLLINQIKMSKSKKNKAVYLQTTEKLSLEELAERVSQIVEHDDASLFVAMFEKMYESWQVTEECIKHFKSLEVVYNKGLDENDKNDLSPESLL